MAKEPGDGGKAVPTGRIGRLARVAKLAGGVAGGMLAEGTRQWRAGRRPRRRDLVLTPANARRVTEQLAEMRGAAMKLGQILSMDNGELLPPELAEILARLRSDARAMPVQQLRRTMSEAYGEDWETLFYGFDFKPLAAASIGQVHRAYAPDGRDIVLKIQYPGVAASIDSDIDNMAAILRMSGLLPDRIDLDPLLRDAKAQLREEADYLKEADFLTEFGRLLAADERFVVPEVLPDLTRHTVLAMTYVDSSPIESLLEQPQQERDRVMTALLELMLRELFELRLVQTDPNFANYRYCANTGSVALLDFGASRRFEQKFVDDYRDLVAAAEADDESGLVAAAERLGYAMGEADTEFRSLIMRLFELGLEPLSRDEPYDFGASDMAARMVELGEQITSYQDFWHAPPTDAVYFHRKLGGMFLLAARLGARVNTYRLMRPWLT